MREATAPLTRFLDFWHALRWLSLGPDENAALDAFLNGMFGPPVAVVAGETEAVAPPEPSVEEGAANLFGQDRAFVLHQGNLFHAAEANRENYHRALNLIERSRALAAEQHFLHWQVAFPGVWENWTIDPSPGGFDVVIGNPPWDRIKLQEVEWFAARRPEIAHAMTAAERAAAIARLRAGDDPLAADYERAKQTAETAARVARSSGQYPLLSRGDINLYALFLERAHRLIKPEGIVGMLVPSGIAADMTASRFFRRIATGEGDAGSRLLALLDFENRRRDGGRFFPDVDGRFKFCTYVAGGTRRRAAGAECAFFLHDVDELLEPSRLFRLTDEDFAAVNPNTGTAPVFRSARDAQIATSIYRRFPVLVDRRHEPPLRAWPVDYTTMFHMTNDSHRFRTRVELERQGAYAVQGRFLKHGQASYLPLYEGKMVQAFDHRAAWVEVDPARRHRPGQPVPATPEQHADPAWSPEPQFWVAEQDIDWIDGIEWLLGFKDVTSPTNARTVIAAIVPRCGASNKLPLLRPDLPRKPELDAEERAHAEWQVRCAERVDSYRSWSPLLLANLDSFALDFVARQKIHGQTLNLFILEQLPIVSEDRFDQRVGSRSIGEMVREEVLCLMTAFARDQGYEGPPFAWDEEDRLRRRARLDALFFLLHGLDGDAVSYVLDQFPIVRRHEENAFGRYRSKDLILGYLAAFRANDPDAEIAA